MKKSKLRELEKRIDNSKYAKLNMSSMVKENMLEYGKDVIEDRALSDYRDGFKPAQRRLLTSMCDLHAFAGSMCYKSARITGDSMGKYHPHSDSYGVLVGMATSYCPIVFGKGNFGSLTNGPAASRYCFVGSTLVDTEFGLIKIKDLPKLVNKPTNNTKNNVNIRVSSLDNSEHTSKWYNLGEHDVVKVSTTCGYDNICTPNQPFLVLNSELDFEWKTTEQLKAGDRIAIKRSNYLFPKSNSKLNIDAKKYRRTDLKVELPKTMSSHLAKVVGFLLSDGYFVEREVEFCNTDKKIINDYVKCLKQVIPEIDKFLHFRTLKIKNRKNCYFVSIYNPFIIDFFNELGLNNLRSSNLVIPDVILKSSREEIISFLSAYFAGDGGISKKYGNFYCVSTSKKLLRQIKVLLLKLGIVTSRVRVNKKYETKNNFKTTWIIYTLGEENSLRFFNEIGISTSEKYNTSYKVWKKRNLCKFTNSKTDIIPNIYTYLKNLLDERNVTKLGHYLIDDSGNKIRKGDIYRLLLRGCSYYKRWIDGKKLEEIKRISSSAYLKIKNILDKNYFFDEITSIRKLKNKKVVYDITVPTNHAFTANGVIAHNTEARISKIGMKVVECNAVMETVPNYDGTLEEPVVFPSRLPNYFINGSSGIAVGISCNMPSFNLIEVANALKYVVRKGKETTAKGIWKRMPAPDYKYGGKLLSSDEEVIELYKNGYGSLKYSCDYTFEKTDKGNIRCIITGFCPTFNPNDFLFEMAKQIDKGTVIEAVDTTDKVRGNRIEVECKSYSLFEKFVKCQLEKTESYRFYALEREKTINNPEKDIDVEVISPNLVELMKMWVDWRRVIETKMLKLDLKNTREKLFKEKVKLNASQNINIIMDSVKQDKIEPRDYLVKKLPILVELVKKGKKEKAYEGADFIGEQKIFSLKKTDQKKTKENIKDLRNQIEKIKFDIENIDDVVIKYLNELTEIKYLDDEKKFSTERKLKVGVEQETISVKTKLSDYAICAISSDGKKDLLDTNSKKRVEQIKLCSTMDKVFYSDCNAKTYSCEPQEFEGKERNWTTSGIAPSDCHRFLFRTNNGKINIINNEGSDLFTGVKLKNDESIVQMEPIYRGSKLIIKSTTNAIKILNSNEYESCRKNSLGKSSKTGFKNIQTLTVCHKGCKIITRDNKILEPDEVTKHTKILGIVGDKNFVILENGKRLYATIEELSKLERIKYITPLKFSGRKPIQNKE